MTTRMPIASLLSGPDVIISSEYGSWYQFGSTVNHGLVNNPPDSLTTILKRIPNSISGAAVMQPRCRSADYAIQQRIAAEAHSLNSTAPLNIRAQPQPTTVQLTPVLGFGGWYKGRKCGKIGVINIHKAAISVEDPAHTWSAQTNTIPSYLESIPMGYKVLEEIAQKKFPTLILSCEKPMSFAPSDQTSKLILNLRSKLESKYPRKFKRERSLWLAFSGKDLQCTKRCSPSDFFHCLRLLNMTTTDDEMKALCLEFRSEESPDTIDYFHFIYTICDESNGVEAYNLSPF